MSFQSRLRDIFGWGSRSPSLITKAKRTRDEAGDYFGAPSLTPGDHYNDTMNFDRQNRRDRYDIYDAMDQLADVSSVLDAYAEDATQQDPETKQVVWIKAKNKKIETEGNKLLHQTLNVNDWIEGVHRDTGKFGDDFCVLQAAPKIGIRHMVWRDPRDIERIENQQGVLIGFEETALLGAYKQKVELDLQNGGDGSGVETTYKPWDVIHFRIYRRKRLPHEKKPNVYGTSLLAGSERIAKQVKILDDLLMIMRITRSLDRKTYFVDVGRSPVEEEVRILKRWRRALKRRKYVDPTSGRFDSRFDPYAWSEDEFWPVKENSNSRVDVTQGITNVNEIADIDHFRDKFFGSLRAPKGWFGYEGDVENTKSLSSQSVKWARGVFSLQRAVRQGLKRLCQIHFAYIGINVEAEDFEVMMVPPSLIELIERLEAWQQVIDVAERMASAGEILHLKPYEWSKYILTHVLWLTDQEIRKLMQPKEEEPPSDQTDAPPLDQKQEPPTKTAPPQKDQPEPTGDAKDTSPPPEPDQDTKKESGNGSSRVSIVEIDQAIRAVANLPPTTGAPKQELPPVSTDN